MQTNAEQFLDRAQLIRHYCGLNAYRRKNTQALTLLYILWEPLNWQTMYEFNQHRKELEMFTKAVSGSEIAFRWMSYNDLWTEWAAVPVIVDHATNLKERYELSLK